MRDSPYAYQIHDASYSARFLRRSLSVSLSRLLPYSRSLIVSLTFSLRSKPNMSTVDISIPDFDYELQNLMLNLEKKQEEKNVYLFAVLMVLVVVSMSLYSYAICKLLRNKPIDSRNNGQYINLDLEKCDADDSPMTTDTAELPIQYDMVVIQTSDSFYDSEDMVEHETTL